MKVKGFLLVVSTGTDTKFLKTAPRPMSGEVCIPVALDIPDALFYPPKMPTVEVTIDESVLPQIRAINEHVEGLQDAGVRVRLVNGADPA